MPNIVLLWRPENGVSKLHEIPTPADLSEALAEAHQIAIVDTCAVDVILQSEGSAELLETVDPLKLGHHRRGREDT